MGNRKIESEKVKGNVRSKQTENRNKLRKKGGKDDKNTAGKRICKKTPKKCSKEGGVCTNIKDQCDELISEDFCKGASCRCCKASAPEPINCKKVELLKKCTKKNGKCKEKCSKKEKEIKKGCAGEGCKCCAKDKKGGKCKEKKTACTDAGGKCKT